MQTQKVIEYITNWLKNYAEKAGMSGFVIGISGGIDSENLGRRNAYPPAGNADKPRKRAYFIPEKTLFKCRKFGYRPYADF